ncbi:glycosyltransferase family 39 protein, partial [bacterium]|nr:glycosyltransferase family 39 protein [bacterium]
YRTIYYSLTGNYEKLRELAFTPQEKPWNSFLFYSFVLPSYIFFGISSDVAVITSSLFHLLITIFTYLVGARLTSNKTGLIAALICSLYPIIFNMSRQYSPNPAFVFFILMTIYFLLKTEGFVSRKYSLLAGIASGFALLLGYTNGTFIIAGYISEGWKIYRMDKKKDSLINLTISIVISFIMSFWWYLLHWDTLLKTNQFIRLQFGTLAGSSEIFSLNSLLHYSACLIYGQIYLLPTILAVIGLVFYIIKKKEERFLTILWIAIPYVFFTLAYEAKNTRYTMPYLPLLAICTSYMLCSIKGKALRRSVIGLVLIHSFLVHILSSFEFKGIPGEVSYETSSKICYKIPLYGTLVWGRIKPDGGDYKLEEILLMIDGDFKNEIRNSRSAIKKFTLLFAPESPYFRPVVTVYYAALWDIPMVILPIAVRQFDYYIAALYFDYIVLKTANSMSEVLGKTRPQMEKGEKVLLSLPPVFSSIFHILKDVPLYDGSHAVVLKKVVKDPWDQDDNKRRLLEEGLAVNPESPFLHFKYAMYLKDQGEILAFERECSLVEYWYKKNQKDTGYLFLDYKEMTEDMISKCK